MFRCQFCYRKAFLILNTCAKCDPALHKSHAAALASVVDWDTVTPEMVKDYQVLQHRKAAQQSVHPTAFGVGMLARFRRFVNLIRYRLAIIGGGDGNPEPGLEE